MNVFRYAVLGILSVALAACGGGGSSSGGGGNSLIYGLVHRYSAKFFSLLFPNRELFTGLCIEHIANLQAQQVGGPKVSVNPHSEYGKISRIVRNELLDVLNVSFQTDGFNFYRATFGWMIGISTNRFFCCYFFHLVIDF
jgi:hypothetical protein